MELPLGLVFLKDLALGVVANGAGLDEAAQVELLGPEHGHDGLAVCFWRAAEPEPVVWEMVGDMGDIAILKFRGQSLMMPSLRRLAGKLPTFLVLVTNFD